MLQAITSIGFVYLVVIATLVLASRLDTTRTPADSHRPRRARRDRTGGRR